MWWPIISRDREWWPMYFIVFFDTVLGRERSGKVSKVLFGNFYFWGITIRQGVNMMAIFWLGIMVLTQISTFWAALRIFWWFLGIAVGKVQRFPCYAYDRRERIAVYLSARNHCNDQRSTITGKRFPFIGHNDRWIPGFFCFVFFAMIR